MLFNRRRKTAREYELENLMIGQLIDVTGSPEIWGNFLRAASRNYRFSYANLLLIFRQRPDASLVMAYDTWKKIGRYVKRGTKGIAIMPEENALRDGRDFRYLRYVHDIKDTGGRSRELAWELDKERLSGLLEYIAETGTLNDDRFVEVDGYKELAGQGEKGFDEQKNLLKLFTGTYVWAIIKEEYSSELGELDIGAQRFVYKSIMYVLGNRCGFELSDEEKDFGDVRYFRDEYTTNLILSVVCGTSRSVLGRIYDTLKIVHENNLIARRENDVTRVDLHREERDIVPEHQNAERPDRGAFESRQIRTDGDEFSQGEQVSPVYDVDGDGQDGRENGGGGLRSQPTTRPNRGGLSNGASTDESGRHNGDVETSGAGGEIGRGNRHQSSGEPVSLGVELPSEDANGDIPPELIPTDEAVILDNTKDEELEKELNRELDEINSFGGSERIEAGEFVQASFLFDENSGQAIIDFPTIAGKRSNSRGSKDATRKSGKGTVDGWDSGDVSFISSYDEPKKQVAIPHDYMVEALLSGSGFRGGRSRIYQFYQNDDLTASERAKLIKNEYGVGGASWPLEGHGLWGYDSYFGKGFRIQWRDAEGDKQGYLSWNRVEKEIHTLIKSGIYYKVDVSEAEHEVNPSETASEKEITELPDIGIDNVVKLNEQLGPRHNYRYTDRELPKAGQKTRFNWNINAIKLLKQIEDENRTATPEEQNVLANYIGWGGLAQAFDAENMSWKNEFAEAKELLNEAEYNSARASVNNAFYTTPKIAGVMYDALVKFGFSKGNILEPAMGIGNFFGVLPEKLLDCKLYGIEVDDISGRIAKQLYQNAEIVVNGFEKTNYPDNFFDVIIGNVPFGDYKLHDPKYNKLGFRIHDYFIAKSLDHVRPGGIVAVITSKGTLDKKNPAVRKYIAQRAELVGAVRLPNHAFKESAGTEVTSDILFLQKRERMIASEPDWVHLGFTDDGIPVNAYFVTHPEMMLGRMSYEGSMYGSDGKETACINDDPDFDISVALSNIIAGINAEIVDISHQAEDMDESRETIPADPEVRNFTYTLVDGKLYYRENSVMIRKKLSEQTEERIRKLHVIRNITRDLIEIQLSGCSEPELKDKQAALNREYDQFVKKYGYISGKANKSAFRNDSDYPLLASLEVIDEDGMIGKAEMFHKQTIRQKTVIDRVETVVEALNVSINEFGYVNIPFMFSIYNPDANNDIDLLTSELSGVIYRNPLLAKVDDTYSGWETADEYLSGNVREKLRHAKAEAENNLSYAINVEALEKVQPEMIDASDIEVRIGTAWIEPEDYERFIYELLDTPFYSRAKRTSWRNSGIQVILEKFSLTWRVENKGQDNRSVAATKTFGTSRMDAYTIFEETLNLRTVTIRDRVEDGDGNVRYVTNKNQTMLAREKQNQIKSRFREWLFAEPERRNRYVDYYNETFNAIRLREYDGSHLTFPGMSPEILLNEHQINAVARIILGGNTLLAHAVGAGKSFEMIAGCMEQKRLGLVNKTCLIVPKPLIVQMASEFLRLYPSANILVTTERDFEMQNRKKFIARIATGDYDAVIMSHSQFEKIPISAERKEKYLSDQIAELSAAIEAMKRESGARWTVKQIESQKKKLESQLEGLYDEVRKDDLINFEELGIDSLMVDEAHSFKNMAIFSKMNNVAGISSAGAKKSTDMLLKCQYINEISKNRGVVFATGTPISNTMCEMYVMQLYLQKPALEQMGIYHFDAWAANFGEVTTAMELSAEGSGFRFRSRFNKFVNVPELMTIFREIADIKTAEMLALPVPKLRDGKYIIVASEPDEFVKEVMISFAERAEAIRSGNIDPRDDNFLKITHEARLLGTDARLLFSDAPNNPDGKLNRLVENVYNEYQMAVEKGIIGCQLIFSDIGTPGKDKGFTVYDYIKANLIRYGITAEEIAFIHDAKTDAQRDKLFKDVRNGKKKILIGSTDKCGTGVNVQTHLVAMHHVDCPWKASSIEQREGRGIRQGNVNEEVAVYRYVTKNTFDAYMWGLVENKQRFVSQIMTGRMVSRTCEDIDEAVLSYAEIKAIATGNPLIKEKLEIDVDVQRLKILKSSYDSQRYRLQDDFMIKYPKLLKAAEEKLACVNADLIAKDEAQKTAPDFAVTIGKAVYVERVDGGKSVMDAANRAKTGETTVIGGFKGFELLVEKNHIGVHYLVLRGKTEYKTEMSASPVGNMVKLDNLFESIHEKVAFLEEKIESYRRDLASAKAEYEKPFVHEMELRKKLARQEELDGVLLLDNQEVEMADLGGMSDYGKDGRDEICVANDLISYNHEMVKER